MAATPERRVHTDAFKRKAVERILAGRITPAEFADEKDIAASLVRGWCRDPRYGGKPGAFTRKAKANGAANGGLPTKPASGKGVYKRSRKPVPLTWACPHCGGPLLIGDER